MLSSRRRRVPPTLRSGSIQRGILSWCRYLLGLLMMKWRGAEGVELRAPQKSVLCSQAGTNNARRTDDGVARVGRAGDLRPDTRHERPHTLEDGGDGADRFHDRFLEL